MLFQLEIPIPENQQIDLPILKTKRIELFVKREDTIHPFVSGNKFRKLKYNIEEAKRQGKETLLTFGGAFSNHIAATAAAGKIAGFKTIGVIRGDELGKDVAKTLSKNETLRNASENGMQFKFITRESYRNKTSEEFINQLKKEFGDFYLVPEGGTNALAVKGCEEILTNEDEKFDYICCAVGTGGTISGLINTAKKHQKVIGFPVLKGDFLVNEIKPFINQNEHWSIQNEYHFGGYGKYNEELIRFINKFNEQTSILLDPIYTGKMLFGILDLVAKGTFPISSKLLAIHTGGVQGIAGVNQKLKNKKQELIKV
ncbi:pyridoxal-phosphate dependent enzyme [Tenacibaculum sp. FZY0031]|uniref:1-aminocyclopropane-1-carboxylate deaminase/D-cysteine desulfhydrase n=1 Tax=Tenacibaculum sp. FZY0031 TaxID=3116648 RepID=UPI002EADB855|nr:pyridoxal-phosphate dependent enzyme [Tenacibaculum sp. FZY0031]